MKRYDPSNPDTSLIKKKEEALLDLGRLEVINKRKQATVVQVSKQPEIIEGKKTLEIKGN